MPFVRLNSDDWQEMCGCGNLSGGKSARKNRRPRQKSRENRTWFPGKLRAENKTARTAASGIRRVFPIRFYFFRIVGSKSIFFITRMRGTDVRMRVFWVIGFVCGACVRFLFVWWFWIYCASYANEVIIFRDCDTIAFNILQDDSQIK